MGRFTQDTMPTQASPQYQPNFNARMPQQSTAVAPPMAQAGVRPAPPPQAQMPPQMPPQMPLQAGMLPQAPQLPSQAAPQAVAAVGQRGPSAMGLQKMRAEALRGRR
jgi:hypothetical protein